MGNQTFGVVITVIGSSENIIRKLNRRFESKLVKSKLAKIVWAGDDEVQDGKEWS